MHWTNWYDKLTHQNHEICRSSVPGSMARQRIPGTWAVSYVSWNSGWWIWRYEFQALCRALVHCRAYAATFWHSLHTLTVVKTEVLCLILLSITDRIFPISWLSSIFLSCSHLSLLGSPWFYSKRGLLCSCDFHPTRLDRFAALKASYPMQEAFHTANNPRSVGKFLSNAGTHRFDNDRFW